jgi:hypothetical protein
MKENGPLTANLTPNRSSAMGPIVNSDWYILLTVIATFLSVILGTVQVVQWIKLGMFSVSYDYTQGDGSSIKKQRPQGSEEPAPPSLIQELLSITGIMFSCALMAGLFLGLTFLRNQAVSVYADPLGQLLLALGSLFAGLGVFCFVAFPASFISEKHREATELLMLVAAVVAFVSSAHIFTSLYGYLPYFNAIYTWHSK